jgi:hypothetical protein
MTCEWRHMVEQLGVKSFPNPPAHCDLTVKTLTVSRLFACRDTFKEYDVGIPPHFTVQFVKATKGHTLALEYWRHIPDKGDTREASRILH